MMRMFALGCLTNFQLALRSVLIGFAVIAVSSPSAWALITGGEGNKPLNDPGWPKGAAVVFNTETRVAWWEGPPFGGGQWHAECRGDATALSLVLQDYAKVDIPKKRVVLHDGFGQSFWLGIDRKQEPKPNALIDWTIMVWQPASLKFQQDLPARFRGNGQQEQPLAQIDVYTGGFVRWDDVIVPKGLEIIDERLEAHGFKVTDGNVLEGTVVDHDTNKPLRAKVIVQGIDPRKQGGVVHPTMAESVTDDNGHWVVKNVVTGRGQVVISADGYVPRIIAYGQYDDKPRWSQHDSSLCKVSSINGRVVDADGKPLDDVTVQFEFETKKAERYDTTTEAAARTDAMGRFRHDNVPAGAATIWVRKTGYVRPGLGVKVDSNTADLKLEMQRAARLQVKVDFSATTRPEGYIVHVHPEGGEAVGKWSGSGNIDAEGQITYEVIPPGRYTIKGRPNPGSDNQETAPVTYDLKPGELTTVTIKAK